MSTLSPKTSQPPITVPQNLPSSSTILLTHPPPSEFPAPHPKINPHPPVSRPSNHNSYPFKPAYAAFNRRWNPQSVFAQDRFISYFVDNIPEGCSPKRLFEVISRSERVLDVVIPIKRSVRDTRFGFARFLRNPDKEDERRSILNEIRIDNVQLSFNIARYGARNSQQRRSDHKYIKNHNGLDRGPPSDRHGDKKDERQVSVLSPQNTSLHRTFAAVLKDSSEKSKDCSIQSEVQGDNMAYNLSWLCRSAVGTIFSDFNFVSSIPSEIGVKLFGGDMLLLTFPSAEAMNECLISRSEPWLSNFSDLHPWRADDKRHRRLCWVSLFNVPVQGWHKDNFRKIVAPFGRFVKADSLTLSLERVDVAKVCIITGQTDWINEEVLFCMGGIKHTIAVQESTSWELPYESDNRDLRMSTAGADIFQSPLSIASVPRNLARAETSDRRSLLNAITGEGNISPTHPSPTSDFVTQPNKKQDLCLREGQRLSELAEGSLNLQKIEKKTDHLQSSDKADHVQNSLDQPVILLCKKKKKSSIAGTKKQRELSIADGPAIRKAETKSIKEVSTQNRSLSIRLSNRLMEKSIRRRNRFKVLSVEGSMEECPESGEVRSKARKKIITQVITEPVNKAVPPQDEGEGMVPSRVIESIEAQQTLEVINLLGLASNKPEAELVQHLQKKIEKEAEEWNMANDS